jgi:PTH1 family peptidyl-tRNA hydrolase
LKNIEECLGTTEYARIRIGIGDDFKHGEQVDFVLGALSEEEQSQMPQICSKITEGIRNFTTIGPDRAMNLLNTRAKNV